MPVFNKQAKSFIKKSKSALHKVATAPKALYKKINKIVAPTQQTIQISNPLPIVPVNNKSIPPVPTYPLPSLPPVSQPRQLHQVVEAMTEEAEKINVDIIQRGVITKREIGKLPQATSVNIVRTQTPAENTENNNNSNDLRSQILRIQLKKVETENIRIKSIEKSSLAANLMNNIKMTQPLKNEDLDSSFNESATQNENTLAQPLTFAYQEIPAKPIENLSNEVYDKNKKVGTELNVNEMNKILKRRKAMESQDSFSTSFKNSFN